MRRCREVPGRRCGQALILPRQQCPYTFNIDLPGDKGAIRDNRIFAAELFPGATDRVEAPTIRPDPGDVTHHPFDGEIADFVEGVLAGKDAELSFADAAHTHAVAFALDRSASQGRPVQLSEIWGKYKAPDSLLRNCG